MIQSIIQFQIQIKRVFLKTTIEMIAIIKIKTVKYEFVSALS